jgi:polyhydroxybutyrate depolymerase
MKKLFVLALFGCSSTPSMSGASLIQMRPYDNNIPASYKGQPTPLLILLHGFGQNGFIQNAYFGLNQASEDNGFLLAFPDGTKNSMGQRFWNATDACCDLEHSGVDDVAYINAVIDDMERQYNVDKKRVYLTGHSNGGFMSHRMACDSANRIAAIASLAGAVWKDPSKCNPARPVPVLEIHGDMDTEVPYDGGPNPGDGVAIPSAPETVATWAQKNGCTGDLADTGETKDLDFIVDGPETHVSKYTCTNGAAELWTMKGVGHLPNVRQPDWGNALWSFLSRY